VDAGTIIIGSTAISAQIGGCVLVIREFRRRDRKDMQRTIDDQVTEIGQAHRDYIECRRYAFDLATQLADHGIDVEPPPKPGQVAS
jgi:low affinity Fe/Cu permease